MDDKITCVNCRSDRRIPVFLIDNPLRRLFWPPKKLVEKYVQSGQVVADLGCGSGFYALPIAWRVGDHGKVYAIDFDRKAIRALEKKAEKHGLTNIVNPRVSSAAEVGFIPSGSVDFVLAHGLLCCMVDHAGAVKEIKRILKPSGQAYTSISKVIRRKDPRAVHTEEWEEVLKGFRVLRRGESLTQRWALVSLDQAHKSENEQTYSDEGRFSAIAVSQSEGA